MTSTGTQQGSGEPSRFVDRVMRCPRKELHQFKEMADGAALLWVRDPWRIPADAFGGRGERVEPREPGA